MKAMCVKIKSSEEVHGHCPATNQMLKKGFFSPEVLNLQTTNALPGPGWQAKGPFLTNGPEIFWGVFCLLGVFHPNNLSYYSSPSNTAKSYDHQHTLMRNELWVPSRSFRKAFRRNKYFQCVPVPALGFALGPDFVLEEHQTSV